MDNKENLLISSYIKTGSSTGQFRSNVVYFVLEARHVKATQAKTTNDECQGKPGR